ncbi:MAG: formylglycine-generating enzyme family protein, partial [Planctomycetota bacterium]
TNEARRLAKIARDETTAKTQALAEYQKMADARRLENADREARQLWPVGPDIVDDLMAWQTRYAPLFARLPAHEQALVELESQALPYTAEDRTRDFAEELDLIQQIKDSLAPLRPEFRREYEARMKRLTKVVDGRRSWDFGEDVDRQFRHGALRRLTSAYRKFEVPDTGVRASIAKRLEQSRRIQDETIINQQELWDACIARIKESKKYGGMELSPQLGLVPLGANPTSGFEEFLHWQTHDGPLPQRNAKGRWSLSEKTGVVFALLPRGTFLMGSQNERPEDKRYDKLFRDNELLHEVTLDAFFISKFEMTQGQWKRFTGEVPSSYLPGFKSRTMIHAITAAHPVENVTWFRCRKVLRQLGMLIPTEAQWEYAARAGQDSLYSGTSDPAELGRFANMPGIETKGLFGNADSRYADDYPTHAPVGSFDPNEFGLYDMNGNLWEWCRDRFGTYQNPTRPGDGLRPSAASNRQYRGGSFGGTPEQQRLAYRTETNPELKFNGLGIRPSRRIEP